ncbi:hypothetical protein RDABS01_017206 [Bienertia sinuspersici]
MKTRQNRNCVKFCILIRVRNWKMQGISRLNLFSCTPALDSKASKLEGIDILIIVRSGSYKRLVGEYPKVCWRRIVYNYSASLRRLFVLWLMLQRKLVMAKVLRRWQVQCNIDCVFYNSAEETLEH